MCGIFAYSGRNNATQIVLDGLKRLDYRGYDSWGVAVAMTNDKLQMPNDNGQMSIGKGILVIKKQVGKIEQVHNLKLPKSNVGIGHTRWATHGAVTLINAHPHFSADQAFCLAQNGIVENYEELKKELTKKGYKFYTQTDTEVIVRLIEEKVKTANNFLEAIRVAFNELKGRNTIIILTKLGEIIACRNGSPLVVGISNKQWIVSSDVLSFAHITKDVCVIENGQMIEINKHTLKIYDTKSGREIKPLIKSIDLKNEKVDKGKFPHFMLKEIYDTPHVLEKAIDQPKELFAKFIQRIKFSRNIYTIGSGTAGIAAAQIAYYLRSIAKINAMSLIGADAFEYISLMNHKDMIIAPSQSGETADVLEVLEKVKSKGAAIASYVNMPASAMSRISDFPFMAHAGAEICVMSTKIFTSQIAWGYLAAMSAVSRQSSAVKEIRKLSETIKTYLHDENNNKSIKDLARKLKNAKHIFLLGKAQNLQIIKEAMVKIIEGSYIHAHAIPAGDLKHYAITLIEKGTPVIFAISNDEVKNDVLNAAAQVKARGAKVIAVASENNQIFDEWIKVPVVGNVQSILNIIPFQLLAYQLVVLLGNNVDKPRNIAKSVTVK